MRSHVADTIQAQDPTGRGRRLLAPLCLIPLLILGGCGKEKDPVVSIRELVPEIAAALNRKDIGGLRRLGTGRLEANRLIIDVFPDGRPGALALDFKRVRLLGDSAELTVEARFESEPAAPPREILFVLKGDKRWRIDSYTFPVAADTAAALTTDTT